MTLGINKNGVSSSNLAGGESGTEAYGLERTVSNTGSVLSDTSSLTSTSTVWRIQERVPSAPEELATGIVPPEKLRLPVGEPQGGKHRKSTSRRAQGNSRHMSRDNQQRGGEAPSSRASQSEAGSFSSRGSSPSGSMSAWSCCPSPRSPNNMAFCHKPPPSFVPRIKLEALKRQGSVESSSSLSSSKLGDHDSGAPKLSIWI